MPIGRYSFLGLIKEGTTLETSEIAPRIYNAVVNGQIDFNSTILKENQRLDIMAGKVYGNSGYWWIIAAASGIGWGLQCPPGTLVRIPSSLPAVLSLVR